MIAHNFRVLRLSLELVRLLRPVVDRLDGDVGRQLRRAGTSVVLNLAEGNGRSGRDRKRFFRIAKGSLGEVEAALLVSVAWGQLRESDICEAAECADGVGAMLGGLLR